MFNPKNRVDVSDSFETMSQIHSETTRKPLAFKVPMTGGRGGIRRPSTSGDPKIKAGFTSVRKQTYL